MTQGLFHPLSGMYRPSWASGRGEDRYGVFVDLQIAGVTQRMRWIPPGEFLMGSPDSEEGRYRDEGPQHPVRLTEGFWLADTACTQELWEAVMQENPSEFVSRDRPVERVSWQDCQRFLEEVEKAHPGLRLRLPTEAQWEYACRAETAYATWMGEPLVAGQEGEAAFLDRIAWYQANSTEGFELEEGFEASQWGKGFSGKAGTHPVKKKAANPWGLLDMLGNVWEWCSDRASGLDLNEEGYLKDLRVNPEVTEGPGRVIRGGSWGGTARFLRAAIRLWNAPEDRDSFLGFRLSRGPDPLAEPREAAAEKHEARDEPV